MGQVKVCSNGKVHAQNKGTINLHAHYCHKAGPEICRCRLGAGVTSFTGAHACKIWSTMDFSWPTRIAMVPKSILAVFTRIIKKLQVKSINF